MMVIDDVELGQRLRALRADPPANGFEALLARRLLEAEPELNAEPSARPAGARMGRVIVGPWLRRHPVRLVGAAALLLAGAAAAVEGGVVEWVQLRVAARAVDAPAPSSAVSDGSKHAPRAERPHAGMASREAAAPTAGAPVEALPSALPAAELASPARGAAPAPSAPDGSLASGAPVRAPASAHVDREGVARAARLMRERRDGTSLGSSRAAVRRSDAVLPTVPRVAIEPRPLERMERVDRVDPSRPRGHETVGPEPGRDLERIRDIARARRERTGAERPRVLERLRERREHNETDGERGEGRGTPSERGRREHSGR